MIVVLVMWYKRKSDVVGEDAHDDDDSHNECVGDVMMIHLIFTFPSFAMRRQFSTFLNELANNRTR